MTHEQELGVGNLPEVWWVPVGGGQRGKTGTTVIAYLIYIDQVQIFLWKKSTFDIFIEQAIQI